MNRPKSVVPLNIELTDIITPKSCSFYIAELIKYIAFTKQQIPYPYERLKMFVMKRRERQKLIEQFSSGQDLATSVRTAFLMEKYYKKVEEAFDILDRTFKCIEEKLMQSNENPVEEIVVLFGATPVSPRDVYRIKIPLLTHGHFESQHIVRRQIANLFRNIIISDEVNANLQRRVGLTNMFVLLKVKEGAVSNSQWLLPKDQYRLSERAQQVCFSFRTLSHKPCTCCIEVNQFEALSREMSLLSVSGDKPSEDCPALQLDNQFVWLQTLKSLKGFRDCKSDGKSVTDLWYKHSFIS